MSFTKIIIVAELFVVVMSNRVQGQSELEMTLRRFNNEEVRGYVQPMGDLLGANMNAGFYHSVKISTNGFHVRVDLIGMASFVKDKHRMYDAKLPEGFVPVGGSFKTATVFGGKGTTFKDVRSGLEYKGSDGLFSTSVIPLFIPQLTIGTMFGTEAYVRFISTPSLGGGKFPPSSLFGVGGRHSISQYFWDSPPFDAAIGGSYSTFALGDLVSSNGISLNLQVSKSFSLVTLYGGTAWERSLTSINYETIEPRTTLVNLVLDGGNKFRFTAGLEIDLLAVKVFADANFGYVDHFSGGIGFGF